MIENDHNREHFIIDNQYYFHSIDRMVQILVMYNCKIFVSTLKLRVDLNRIDIIFNSLHRYVDQ